LARRPEVEGDHSLALGVTVELLPV
jgi:hypothetical protein